MQDLAFALARDCFGPDVEAVCRALWALGDASLAELLDRVRPSLQPRSSMAAPPSSNTIGPDAELNAMAPEERAVLALGLALHHGLAVYQRSEALRAPSGKLRPGTVRYKWQVHAALRLLSVPRIAAHAQTLFGIAGSRVISTLATLGGLPEAELVDACVRASADLAGSAKATVQLMQRRGYLTIVDVSPGQDDEAELVVPSPFGVASAAGAPGARASLLQINFKRFYSDFRDAALVQHVRDKFDDNAAVVAQYMLARGVPLGSTQTQAVTVAEVAACDGARQKGLAVSDVHRCLIALTLDSSPCASLTASSSRVEDLTYCFNVGKVLATLQLSTGIVAVQNKYGRLFGRILRLLQDKEYLDEKTVGDMLMLPGKDARSYLFRLYESRLIRIQELCAKVDHSSQSTHYMWHFDRDVFAAEIINQISRSILNVRLKLAEEKAAAAAGDGYFDGAAERVKRAETYCYTIQARLEDTLMMFTQW